MARILITGAKSDIARAVAREYARQGYDLYLAARDKDSLREFAADITLRTGRNCTIHELDILDFASHQAFYDNLGEPPDVVLVAVGYLGNQKRAESDFDEARRIMDTNFTGIVSLLNIVANDFERRRHGVITGISSVAGERGRKANYIYGAAKAGLTAYLSGLRNRLYSSGVHVITVKPGFVKTKMTEGMELPAKLLATPGEVASAIYRAQQKKQDIVYVKWIWRWIMLVIKTIPEWKFRGMDI
jgi:short-subunit dehydrogenase